MPSTWINQGTFTLKTARCMLLSILYINSMAVAALHVFLFVVLGRGVLLAFNYIVNCTALFGL